MNTLFPTAPELPHGFIYQENFITGEEENDLLQIIATISLKPMIFHGYEAKRRIASFGYEWSFEKRELSKGKPIPKPFEPLIEKTARLFSFSKDALAELL